MRLPKSQYDIVSIIYFCKKDFTFSFCHIFVNKIHPNRSHRYKKIINIVLQDKFTNHAQTNKAKVKLVA